jgi:small GTP-binding protein
MTDEKIKRKVIRLSIIGDSKTGKTSIINRYLGQEFSIDMISNIGIDKQEVIKKMKDGNEMKIIIWDTAGQERFHSISSGTIKNSQGIIVCFALNDRNSFNNVLTWLQDVREISSKIPIVLFGNKCDLIEERKVTNEEAKEFADNNEIIYFETSAKDNINIKEGFEKISEDAYSKALAEEEAKIELLKKNNNNKKNKKRFC